jgi:hypothetical protein
VGRNVTVSPGAPVTPTPDRPVAVAVYVAPDMSVNALCLLDLGAAAYTAGGLALLPPGGCQDSVEEGELSALQVEALHEVVNVLSALYNVAGSPHSRLHKLYAPGEEVAGDLAGMLAGYNRIDLDVEIQGYGKGSISLVVP